MTDDPNVLLPGHLLGPSLTTAGLAAWVFASSGLDADGRGCAELQHLIDAALTRGEHEVLVSRRVLEQSARLWEQAAEILDRQVEGNDHGRSASESSQQAVRLRMRARSLMRLVLSSEA